MTGRTGTADSYGLPGMRRPGSSWMPRLRPALWLRKVLLGHMAIPPATGGCAMTTRFLGLTAALALLTACTADETPPQGTAAPQGPPLPEIVARAIEYHGADVYERSRISMTITSLSGSFRIEAFRDGGNFEYVVTGTVGPDAVERRVRLTNDGV